MKRYDFIIAGGGAAGLSLARRLVHGPQGGGSVLIIDRDAKERNDRTWCFWSRRTTAFDSIAHRSWNRLRFVGAGVDRTIDLGAYRYRMVRGIDFYRAARDELCAHPNVDFLRARVERIEDGAGLALVRAAGRDYGGEWVFDSTFNASWPPVNRARYHDLRQYFHGWEIETTVDRIDPSTPTFLDFRTLPAAGVGFFYMLPLSDRRALVEYVVCSAAHPAPEESQRAIRQYLNTVLGAWDYRVVAKEGGVSPMTDQPFPRRLGRRVMAIGVRGGMVKPSTGFAFTRILNDAEAIARSLATAGHPFDVGPGSRRYRLYDSLMLDIMEHHPDQVEGIFAALFRNNPIERVLRFLDEEGSFGENLSLIASLPPALFLRSLTRMGVLRRNPATVRSLAASHLSSPAGWPRHELSA